MTLGSDATVRHSTNYSTNPRVKKFINFKKIILMMIDMINAKQELDVLELIRNIVDNYSQIPPLCAGRQCNSSAWQISGF